MFVKAKQSAGRRSHPRRNGFAWSRTSRLLRRMLIGGASLCMLFTLTASARVGAGAYAHQVPHKAAVAQSPLSVRHVALRQDRGRIVGTATVVNSGSVRVRSNTGLLGLRQGSGGKPTGILTFSVPALRPRSSTKVQLTTRVVRVLRVGSGTYQALICTDIYSQIRRFTSASNCSSGTRLTISTISPSTASGPAPNTIIKTGVASLRKQSSAAIRFVSTLGASTFECSLDGAPWLPCKSPQRYAALVDGPHAFAVRAISASGAADLTAAHISWTLRRIPRRSR